MQRGRCRKGADTKYAGIRGSQDAGGAGGGFPGRVLCAQSGVSACVCEQDGCGRERAEHVGWARWPRAFLTSQEIRTLPEADGSLGTSELGEDSTQVRAWKDNLSDDEEAREEGEEAKPGNSVNGTRAQAQRNPGPAWMEAQVGGRAGARTGLGGRGWL